MRRIAKEASRIKREKKDRRREERKLEIAKKAGAGARSVFWRPIAPIANNLVGGVFDMRGVVRPPMRNVIQSKRIVEAVERLYSRRALASWRSRASSTD